MKETPLQFWDSMTVPSKVFAVCVGGVVVMVAFVAVLGMYDLNLLAREVCAEIRR